MDEFVSQLEELEAIAKKLKAAVQDAKGNLLKDHQVDWEMVCTMATEAAQKSKMLGLPTRYNLALYEQKRAKYGRGSLHKH